MPVIGSEPPGPARGRFFLIHLAAIGVALLGAAVYLNALQNPFVYDDFRLIVENPSLARPMYLRSVLAWDSTRPLVNLSYAVDTLLWDRTRFGYHVSSVVLHALDAALFFWVAFLAIGDWRHRGGAAARLQPSALVTAVTAATVFAVHPLATEAVGYVSGRSEVLYTAFLLLAFLAGRRWMIGGGAGWWAACAGLWIAGLLSKESAAMLPAILLAYDRLVLAGDDEEHRRRWRHLLLPMFIAATCMAVARVALLLQVEYAAAPAPDWRYALLQIDVFWRYLGILLLPTGQSIFHGVPLIDSVLAPRAFAGILGLGAWLGVAWALRRRAGLIAFALLWFPLMLLPSAALFALGRGEAMAEHRAYLPAAGMFLLWGCAIGAMWSRATLLRLVAAGTAAVFVATLGLLTILRNQVWQDPVALTREAVRLAPDWWVPRMLAGDALRQSERCEEAIVEYRIAIEMRPLDETPYTSLARCLIFERRLGEAEQVVHVLAAVNPASQKRVCDALRAANRGGPAIQACGAGTGHDAESGAQPR